MNAMSEREAIELAKKYLDDEQIRNPCEETTKAAELHRFWMWNPPVYAEGKPGYWSEWKFFRQIAPEAGDVGIHKMSVDMARYFVERPETDRDYWDALKEILSTSLSASDPLIRNGALDDPHLRGWLINYLDGHRVAPTKRPGNRARKYHARDGRIYFAIHLLCDRGGMSQSAAIEWVGKRINLSSEAVTSVYRKARASD